jgi:pimeloyl-ACP methyl ester carboxylesterase
MQMKNKILSLFVPLMVLFNAGNVWAQDPMEDFQGSWLGTMQIPDGPQLRVGVEIFKRADDNWGGNVASLDQDTRYIPVSKVSINDQVLAVQLAGAPIKISGHLDQASGKILAEFIQAEAAFELVLSKVDSLPEIGRPQTPIKPFAYHTEEVRIHNLEDDIWLAGTLSTPAKYNNHQAILLIPGSGPNQRDSYFSGHRLFAVIADNLTNRGYTVLRMDKRGVYKSSGSFQEAKIGDFATDYTYAYRWLKDLAGVQKISLLGHSEGSFVAAMLATNVQVDAIVSMAGPGMSIKDILILQDQTEPQARGASAAEVVILKKFSEDFYQLVLTTQSENERKTRLQSLYDNLSGEAEVVVNKWVERSGTLNVDFAASESFKQDLSSNPIKYWQKVRVPTLILNGSLDSQVPAELNVQGIYDTLIHQSPLLEKHIFTGLNHMFQTAKTGAVEEYREIDETINPVVLAKIVSFLALLNQQSSAQ